MLALSDILAALRWWLVLLGLGTAVFPIAFVLLRPLPDRGYAFGKMIGLLLVSYLFWLLASLGFLQNNTGGILFALALVLAFSGWLLRRRGAAMRDWLRANWRTVLLTELLFLLIFGLWVWVRAQNPAISATEKPMEFAFLNAAVRSPTYPPLDPWLSGYAISYYYFGYVMVSVLARLAVVETAVAFNLGVAWLMAGTAVGAFGLVYNLTAAGKLLQRDKETEATKEVRDYQQGLRRGAALLGVVAALALPVAGNLQIVLEVAHANGVGSAGFWEWLDVRDINGPPTVDDTPRYTTSAWWWWRASRPINEHTLAGQTVEGLEPIAEFPAFSFILGDMHPHVLALPFALLSLAVAFVWMSTGRKRQGGRVAGLQGGITGLGAQARDLVADVGWPLWLFTAVLLGGLSFLNTWDVLFHLFVMLGAYLLGRWRREGWHGGLLPQTALMGLLLGLAAFVLYLPFYIGFQSQAGAPYLLPTLVRPTRLPQFLIIFGVPLWALTILLLTLGARQRFRHWRAGLATAVAVTAGLLLLMLLLSWIIAASADGAGRVLGLANELGVLLTPRPDTPLALGWGAAAVFSLLPQVLAARLAYPGVTLLLAGMLGLVVMALIEMNAPRTAETDAPAATASNDVLPFVLLLAATGALLTLGPEFVYLRDNFGFRLNTIFKFYYQAWVLFGVAALVGLHWLWTEAANRAIPAAATTGYALLLAGSLLFPIYAVRSRAIEYRGPLTAESRLPATLDGLAQLRQFNPDEYDAIRWLRDNAAETAVVLEATGGAYSSYARVSANTGLPTLLGWANHQYQWRGSDTPEPGQRDPVIRELYSSPFWDNTGALLDQYGVDYIYVGGLEISTYGADGALPGKEKFDERLEVAYQNNTVTIYRWPRGN